MFFWRKCIVWDLFFAHFEEKCAVAVVSAEHSALLHIQSQSENGIGGGSYVVGAMGVKFAFGAETPSDTYGCDTCAVGSVGIDTGVANVKDLLLRSGVVGKNREYDGRVGLDRDARDLSFDSGPPDIREEMADEALDG